MRAVALAQQVAGHRVSNGSLRLRPDPARVRESRPAEEIEVVPTVWERTASGVIIALLTGALVGPVFAPTQLETPVLRLMWLPVYAATLGMVWFRRDRMWRAWPAMLALLSLLILTWVSKFWSIDFCVNIKFRRTSENRK